MHIFISLKYTDQTLLLQHALVPPNNQFSHGYVAAITPIIMIIMVASDNRELPYTFIIF